MSKDQYISIEELCQLYEIETGFIEELQENDLISVVRQEEKICVPIGEVQNLEKIQTFYYDLEINVAGIDAILNLLNQIDEMNREITALRRKLDFFEGH